jgi:hypothetical protein
MARAKNIEQLAPADELVFPDPSSFGVTEVTEFLAHPGRVRNLDYSQWAVALIDLRSKPERIAAERRRISAKGYQQLGGSPVVEGWPQAEVYVMPRAIYEQKLAARRQQFLDGIDSGRYTEAVIPREVINRGR